MSHHVVSKRVVIFALMFPTIVTWVYFVALREQPPGIQQGAYLLGKLIQFGFPILWVFLWQRETLQWQPFKPGGLAAGLSMGVFVAGAMLGLYWLVLKPAGFFIGPDEAVRHKIEGMGLTSTWRYALLGVFYAFCHSLLEEYYWRWFVFRQLKLFTTLPVAVAISSIGFMAHHILVLATFFGWQSPATWLFSAAVGVGGALWALLYHRTQSLVAPWVSHCLVDAAIFVLGYDLARELFV